MKFCTDYVAKGMGLVACEQNRKATFFLYPIPKDYELQDIEVSIKGPYSTTGQIIVPAIKKTQKSTNYQRSLYLSGKTNSISPTLQGSTFLRTLTKNYGGDVDDDIKIRIKVTKSNAKVSYIPKSSGIHEISLTTNGSHLIGSPFSVVVEPPTNRSISDDSLSENEVEYKEISRKYVPGVVDVNGEKMFLNENGTLDKIIPKISSKKKKYDDNFNLEIQNQNHKKDFSFQRNGNAQENMEIPEERIKNSKVPKLNQIRRRKFSIMMKIPKKEEQKFLFLEVLI